MKMVMMMMMIVLIEAQSSALSGQFMSQRRQHAVQLNREGQYEDGDGDGDDDDDDDDDSTDRGPIISSLYGVNLYS